jgi:hypothetical protein
MTSLHLDVSQMFVNILYPWMNSPIYHAWNTSNQKSLEKMIAWTCNIDEKSQHKIQGANKRN